MPGPAGPTAPADPCHAASEACPLLHHRLDADDDDGAGRHHHSEIAGKIN
jgi:hypothetical protein